MKYDQQNSYPVPREKKGEIGSNSALRPNLAEGGAGRGLSFEGRIAPELLGLFCILCATLLFISLLSYNPADPSLNHVVRGNAPVSNWAGRFGSYLSAFLADFFGFAAIVPFLFFAVLGVRLCMRASAWAWWRWTGFALLLVCLAVASSFWNAGLGQIRGGGLLGLVLRDSSLRWFNPIGSGFVWGFVFLLVLQMLFGFSWRQLALKAWRELHRSFEDREQDGKAPDAPLQILPSKKVSDSELAFKASAEMKDSPITTPPADAAPRLPRVAAEGRRQTSAAPEGGTALEILATRALERRAGFTSLSGKEHIEEMERSNQPHQAHSAEKKSSPGALFRYLFSRLATVSSASGNGEGKPVPPDEPAPASLDWQAPSTSPPTSPAVRRGEPPAQPAQDYGDQPPWLADLEGGRIGASQLNLAKKRQPFQDLPSISAPAQPDPSPAQPAGGGSSGGSQPFYRNPALNQPGAVSGANTALAAQTEPPLTSNSQKPKRIPPKLPPLDLLHSVGNKSSAVSRDELEAKGRALMTCLSNFSIQAELVRISPGPVVTSFEVRPAPGVKSSRITGLSDDIALSLKSISVRVQAPIPGTDTVGIEIPNDRREIVSLRELMASPAFQTVEAGSPAPLLSMAMGKDISGRPVIADLARMPHMLVAGATGTGKSVFLNSVLLSLLYRAKPDELKLMIVDPKRIEMAVYADLPHLVHPIVVEASLAKNALDWAVAEMERRYNDIARLSVRNMAAYNQKLADYDKSGARPSNFSDLQPMPYLVVVVDELADLMLTAGKDVETSIVRLAQLARAAGIHLIIATQRPSVDVVTGLIKANFPCRVSFQVTSKVDSRTILDGMGAEQLLGKGDMLFKPAGGQLQRLHGAFVPDEDVGAVADYWRAQLPPSYQVDFSDWGADTEENGGNGGVGGFDEDVSRDPMYAKIADFVMQEDSPSISKIQRYFRIGYNRAARYWDQLKKDGIVGPDNKVKVM